MQTDKKMPLVFETKLEKRRQSGNFRELSLVSNLIDFSSNDFLGLSRSHQLSSLVFQEWERHHSHLNGFGSTGSRLLTGNSRYVQELEESIAEFHGYEAGVLFSCGYMANVGLLSAVASSESAILFDSGIHVSVHDGMKLSKARLLPFRHNDLNHLEDRLKSCSNRGECFICIQSIYSTDGSQAPLWELCQLSDRYGAHLIVDEAHAVGVFGPQGRGLVAQNKLNSYVFAQVVTFGKALGTFGAIVLGNHDLKQGLINFSTSYIYTTALPFFLIAAIKCSYELFPDMDIERNQLRKLVQICSQHGLHSSQTQIQAIPFAGNQAAKTASKFLWENGYDVRPLLSPTVRKWHEVLRICLHAFNTEEELIFLLNLIQRAIYA